MSMSAGRLRHRVTIESMAGGVQSPLTGEMVSEWVAVARNVPAEILPLSAREMVAAQAVQSEVSARVVMRRRYDVDATMRLIHETRRGKTIYTIVGIIPDNGSGEEWMTLPVKAGVSDE